MTRQLIRAEARAAALLRVNADDSREPRRERSGIARAGAASEWRGTGAAIARTGAVCAKVRAGYLKAGAAIARAWASREWRGAGAACLKAGRKAGAVAAVLVLLIAGGARNAGAQASRKDDIVFNAQGRPMAGATVRICTAGATGQPCTPLAPLFSDAAMTVALANPTQTDGLGNYNFYAAPGRYMIEISGPGIITKQLPNVILPSDPSAPTFSTLTTTSGISAFSLTLGGNLTVAGSAVVLGTLTVGGAPLPSINNDNQWIADQRFKGPIPYVDFTAFMPPGGCDDFYAGSWSGAAANAMYGTMTSGSTTLVTSAPYTPWKAGCGAFVGFAGATATLATPTGGVVTNHGTAGTTTVHYKVAAVDVNFGVSAASAAFTTTTSNATLGAPHTGNYNNIVWSAVANAVGYIVYSDKISPGTYYPIGQSFQCGNNEAHSGTICGYADNGYINKVGGNGGAYLNFFLPQTPPASPTAGALITTIDAVAGDGVTLTLHDAAANTPPANTYTQHDESTFLTQALNANTTSYTSAMEVLIPYGAWNISRLVPSAWNTKGVRVRQQGTVQLFGAPLFFTGNNEWAGEGQLQAVTGDPISCAQDFVAPWVPAVGVMWGQAGGLNFSGVCAPNLHQDGLIFSNIASGFKLSNVRLQQLTNNSDPTDINSGHGANILIDADVIFGYFDKVALESGLYTDDNVVFRCEAQGNAVTFNFSHMTFVGGGVTSDRGNPNVTSCVQQHVDFDDVSIEGLWSRGFVTTDGGATASGFHMARVTESDPNNLAQNGPWDSVFYARQDNAISVQGDSIKDSGGFSRLYSQKTQPTATQPCYDLTVDYSTALQTLQTQSYAGCDYGVGWYGKDTISQGYISTGGATGTGYDIFLAQAFRRPLTTVTATGGALSAGTYYLMTELLDFKDRQSSASPEVSITVGGASGIVVTATEEFGGGTGCRAYIGSTAGGENQFYSGTFTGTTCTITITSLGGTGGTPVGNNSAMLTELTWDAGTKWCFTCGSSGGSRPIGHGLSKTKYNAFPAGVGFYENDAIQSDVGFSSPFVAVADGVPIAWNTGAGSNAKVTLNHLTGTRALNVSNLANGGNYVLTITQDATGGAAMTLGSGCAWKVGGGGAGAITLSSAANAVDILAFTYDGSACYANLRTNFN